MEVSLLKHPEKSHRKKVTLPKYSSDLAEFFGIMLGDGGINNDWQATITINSVADKEYADYVVWRCMRLFGVTPALHKRKNKQALLIALASTSVVDFLVAEGLPRGNKLAGKLEIPVWVLEKPKYKIACVRGLVDTDGCLYIHRHRVAGKTYKNIGFCFTNFSPYLIRQVASIFGENGIQPVISNKGRSIYLYRASAIEKYLRVFGSSNERITSVYKKLEASDSGLFHRLGKAAYRKVS